MSIGFGNATKADVPAIAALLADDRLGQGRETDDMTRYMDAFRAIEADPNNSLIVGRDGETVIACYQLTFIPGFSLNGTRRAEIEGVRVAVDRRGQGLGKSMLRDAEERARAGGATLLQLAMNRTRQASHAFYEANGFVPSHVGFKKKL